MVARRSCSVGRAEQFAGAQGEVTFKRHPRWWPAEAAALAEPSSSQEPKETTEGGPQKLQCWQSRAVRRGPQEEVTFDGGPQKLQRWQSRAVRRSPRRGHLREAPQRVARRSYSVGSRAIRRSPQEEVTFERHPRWWPAEAAALAARRAVDAFPVPRRGDLSSLLVKSGLTTVGRGLKVLLAMSVSRMLALLSTLFLTWLPCIAW
jgi:hypothetical protein